MPCKPCTSHASPSIRLERSLIACIVSRTRGKGKSFEEAAEFRMENLKRGVCVPVLSIPMPVLRPEDRGKAHYAASGTAKMALKAHSALGFSHGCRLSLQTGPGKYPHHPPEVEQSRVAIGLDCIPYPSCITTPPQPTVLLRLPHLRSTL
jgi:hypothetical protein